MRFLWTFIFVYLGLSGTIFANKNQDPLRFENHTFELQRENRFRSTLLCKDTWIIDLLKNQQCATTVNMVTNPQGLITVSLANCQESEAINKQFSIPPQFGCSILERKSI